MLRYFLKRLLLMIPTLFIILLIVYLLIYSLPGTPRGAFPAYGDGDALDAVYEAVDAPENFITRFIRYCYNIVAHGSLGPSSKGNRSLADDLAALCSKTMTLAGISLLITLFIGIPLGIAAAANRGGCADRAISVVSLILSSIPSYCLALVLVLLFILKLRLLPSVAYDSWKAYILPSVVLCVGGVSLTMRMTRASVIEILDKPYITTLRAKGLRESRVLYIHVLKNSLIPIVSSLNNIAVQVLCSTLIVENFFNINGMGAYLVESVSLRSQYALMGCVFVISLVVMLLSIVCDFLCILVNPQLKSQYSKKTTVLEGK